MMTVGWVEAGNRTFWTTVTDAHPYCGLGPEQATVLFFGKYIVATKGVH